MFSISNVVIIVVETYVRFFQFSSRWYLCARESPYYAPHPFAQKVSQRCLSNSSNVRLNDDGPLSSFQGRSSSASSFHASLLQAIDGVMPSLALCPHVASQAPQHFRSSETQATSDDCFARQSICSVISLPSGMSRAVHPQVFWKVDVEGYIYTFFALVAMDSGDSACHGT